MRKEVCSMKKGTLFVISGPSGCGKGTVLKEVLKNPDLYFSVSATTRDPRPGEVGRCQLSLYDQRSL